MNKNNRVFPLSAAAFLMLILSWPAAAAPSFDCSRVETGSTEELICEDEELSVLDREVDRLYRKIRDQTTDEDFRTIQAMQKGWLSGRNESWKAENPRQFVHDAYQQRIAVLSVQAGEEIAPDPVYYQCSGGEFDSLTAVFYGTSPPVGVFTRTPGGDWPQYIATGWEDSGAIHYNTGGLDFIDRNGNAELNWAGTLMTCSRRPSQ